MTIQAGVMVGARVEDDSGVVRFQEQLISQLFAGNWLTCSLGDIQASPSSKSPNRCSDTRVERSGLSSSFFSFWLSSSPSISWPFLLSLLLVCRRRLGPSPIRISSTCQYEPCSRSSEFSSFVNKVTNRIPCPVAFSLSGRRDFQNTRCAVV